MVINLGNNPILTFSQRSNYLLSRRKRVCCSLRKCFKVRFAFGANGDLPAGYILKYTCLIKECEHTAYVFIVVCLDILQEHFLRAHKRIGASLSSESRRAGRAHFMTMQSGLSNLIVHRFDAHLALRLCLSTALLPKGLFL
jgi:hypothetical protein